MSKPKELSASPSMRDIWRKAKASAEKEAKAAKKEKECKALEKELTSLELELGPSLDKWADHYPDWEKMSKLEAHIEDTIKAYRKKLNEAKTKGVLPNDVLDEFYFGLTDVAKDLKRRSGIAERAIESDESLAVELSKKLDKNLARLTPIVVLSHPDLGRLISAKLTREENQILTIGDLEIEVILSETDVLMKLDESPNTRAKIAEAANFGKVVDDIVEACKLSVADFKANPTKQQEREEQKDLEKAVDEAIKEAIGRAAVEVYRQSKVKSAYRNYKIKTGVSITLNVAGLIGGVASLALAPLTFGPSIIISAVALTKGAVSLGTLIGKSILSAEEALFRLEERVAELIKRYHTASTSRVGGQEVLTNTVNALFPTTFNTIKECAGDCEQVDRKTDGLELRANEASSFLNTMLDKQEKIMKMLRKWESDNRKFLSDKDAKLITKLINKVEENKNGVVEQIQKVMVLNERVAKCREDNEKLSRAIGILKASEPTWAKVAEVLIPIVISIGYTVGTSPAMPGPDAYEFAKTGKLIADIGGTVAGSADNIKTITEEAISAFGK